MASKHLILFLVYLTFFFLTEVLGTEVIRGDNQCVMFGQCGPPDFENDRGEMSCSNNVEAKLVSTAENRAYFEKFQRVCPMLVEDGSTEAFACCTSDQLDTLDSQLTATELLFTRCKSCTRNFRALYCYLICSPDQSKYVNVSKTFQSPGYEQIGVGVAEMEVYISQETAEGLHGSCKDVTFPQTNGKAISLVCNGFTGDDCTPQNVLNFLGSTNNGIAPVEMVFQQIGDDNGVSIPEAPESMDYLDYYTYGCDEAVTNGTEPCSCTDCELTCPGPPPLKEPVAPFTIGEADGISVIVLIVFLVLVLFFLLYLFISYKTNRKSRKNMERGKSTSSMAKIAPDSESDSHSDSSCFTDDTDQPFLDKSEISTIQRWGKASQDFFRKGFTWWGTFVARHPLWVIIPTVAIVAALCVGVLFIKLTTDPVDLWTAESSRVRQEKKYYDDKFGAFYRTEMVIMTLKPEYQGNGSIYTSYNGVRHVFSEILSKKYLLALLELQNKIRYMEVPYKIDGKERMGKLNDICFKPLEPDNNNCTITSAINYWQNDPNVLNVEVNETNRLTGETYLVDYREHFLYCVEAPSTIQDTTPLKQSCMGDFGGPVFPFLAVGGQGKDAPYSQASALILSFVVNNYPKDDERSVLTRAWEKAYLKMMEEWESEFFDLAYFSELSPEEELEKSTETDLVVFVASYIVIFIYITVALGTYTSFKRIPVDSKVSLGIAGILIILASVFTSIGLLGYVGYSTSLIVIEVVPFLVLAIGADNIFILTLEYQRIQRLPDETLPDHLGRVFGDVAPSMLLCSLTECVTFFLGTLTEMPAIEEFAYAAALAILFDFLLQITLFLAVLSLDARRQEKNRFDILCCVKSDSDKEPNKSFLQVFFKKYYAPFLMNDFVRAAVMIGFTALFSWSIILTSNMTVGLDQDLSVPKDSYVLKYFDYMEKYLDVGVPVYFVTKGPYNFSNPNAGNSICGYSGCDTYSMIQQITYASQNPEYWKIETPASSWYDDYVDWLKPYGQASCCRHYPRNKTEFCPATIDQRCTPCLNDGDEYTNEEFMNYLPWFLIDNPGLACNKGGHSAYGNAVNITSNYTGMGMDVVEGSYFMSYHSVCIKSVDCTENLIKARELADNITAHLKAANTDENGNIIGNEEDFEVFPYCLYYVFYEQYLTMVDDSFFLIGICLIPTFIFSFVLLGFDLFSGLITLVTIIMIVVGTAGLSSLWGVHLNAVSLINLVQAIGLSVEFISHVVFTFSQKTHLSRKQRVIDSMGTMGPAVFAGVALTNLPGIIVLNWATAQLIQVFFFRMCLVITLLGMAHGLIFLPVFLSYFGPPVNKALLYDKQQKKKQEREKMASFNQTYEKDVYENYGAELKVDPNINKTEELQKEKSTVTML